MHLVVVSPHLLSVIVSPSFVVLHDLDSLEEHWPGTHRKSSNLGLSVLLMIRLGLWVLGKNMAEVKCPTHHLTSGCLANP